MKFDVWVWIFVFLASYTPLWYIIGRDKERWYQMKTKRFIVSISDIEKMTKQQEFEYLELRGFDHSKVIVQKESKGQYIYEQKED